MKLKSPLVLAPARAVAATGRRVAWVLWLKRYEYDGRIT